jgi:MFS superfamily sulfate permease-like transporter
LNCRLGFIIDFLSKATLIGFMAGAAIIVSLQQLKSLLGITHFTTQMGLVPVLSSVFHNRKEVRIFFLKLIIEYFENTLNAYFFLSHK